MRASPILQVVIKSELKEEYEVAEEQDPLANQNGGGVGDADDEEGRRRDNKKHKKKKKKNYDEEKEEESKRFEIFPSLLFRVGNF